MKATAEQDARPPFNPSLPALQNLDARWYQILDKLGLNVVIVQFDARLESPLHSHPGIEESLGLELQEIGAGFFDSMMFPTPGSMWAFYHCHDLGGAMQQLKTQLAARCLLGITNILHAEENCQLRVWYSWDRDAIGQLVEG